MIINFFDCETTGKLHPDHRIVELSMRLYDTEREEEVLEVLQRLNPERNIDAKAQAVHGISVEDLKGERTFAEVAEQLAEVIRGCDMMVFHNGLGFDLPFLKQEFERVGVEVDWERLKYYDTIQCTFATDLGKSPTLSELSFSLGVDYSPELAHSASYDTDVLKRAFLNGVRFGWITY